MITLNALKNPKDYAANIFFITNTLVIIDWSIS